MDESRVSGQEVMTESGKDLSLDGKSCLHLSIVVFGICGASNGGKTTLAQMIQDKNQSATSIIIHQDDFYKEDDQVPTSKNGTVKLWDELNALDEEGLLDAVKIAKSQAAAFHEEENPPCVGVTPARKHLVIIEGTMLLNMRELGSLMDTAYFLTLDYDTMKERRSIKDYGRILDPPQYFENHVWPSYMRDLKVACSAHKEETVRMLDGARDIYDNLQEIETRIDELFTQKVIT